MVRWISLFGPGAAALRRGRALLCVALLAVAVVTVRNARAETAPVVVRPGALGAFSIVNHDQVTGAETAAPTTRGSLGEFVDGPRPAPLGLGTFRQVLGAADDSQRLDVTGAAGLAGMRPADVTDLSYATFVASGTGGVATTVQMLVDLNGDGRFSLPSDDILTFDPVYQTGGARGDAVPNQCAGVNGCVGVGLWQRWNAAVGGWWSFTASSGPPVTTLSHYQQAHSSARLVTDRAALRFSAGGASVWQGYDGRLDDLRIAGARYDLESWFVVADCAAAADDIGVVQQAIDDALPGFAVRLRGTCDFSAALPHGGSTRSVDAAAVVLGSSRPARDLVIEPDAGPRSAAITGTGVQAAFFIPPDARNITIRGLAFSRLGRAIVIVDAAGVVIGSGGNVTPDPAANTITGDAGMSAAVLAVATDGAPLRLRFGVAGERQAEYAIPATPALTGLTIAGNRIVYDGAGTTDYARDLAAIDVQQAGTATASAITIVRNATWFATNELRSSRMNAVRIEGADVATPRIDDVTVADNVLGRPEDVGEQAPPLSAAGRIAVLARHVSHLRIERNRIRARASAMPVVEPAGGIVLDATSDAVVAGNTVDVAFDATGSTAPADNDLGAIGIYDDLDRLSGGAGGPGISARPTVEANVVGAGGGKAGRGIVLAGTAWADVTDNTVAASPKQALILGSVIAPQTGAPAAPPAALLTSIACTNTLAGQVDDPNMVTAGTVESTNFPGGSRLATNGECLAPGLSFVESDGLTRVAEAGGVDTYTVALDRRPRSDVVTTIAAGTQATVTPSSLTFTPADWASPRTITVQAVQDSIPEGTHLQSLTHTARSTDPDYDRLIGTVLAQIVDDDPGSILLQESNASTVVAEGGTTDTYTLVLGSRPGADVRVVAAPGTQLSVTPSAVTFTAGNWAVPQTIRVTAVDDTVREGPHLGTITHRASSTDANFNATPVGQILASIADNDLPPAPIIIVPAEAAIVRSGSLTITGTGEPFGIVEIRHGATLLGSVPVVAQGRWSAGPFTFTEGPQTVTATLTDRNGYQSPVRTRNFVVDLTPPSAPVIVAPTQDAVLTDAHVIVRGTSEPRATVRITQGLLAWTTTADASGAWSRTITFPAGRQEIVATAFDGAGNPGPASAPRAFVVNADGIPPDPPSILSPSEGAIVPAAFDVTGYSEPNATVQLWEGGTARSSAQADSDGFYRIAITNADTRTWQLRLRAVDESLNVGAFGAIRNVRVDATPPTVSVRRPPGQLLITILLPTDDGGAMGAAFDTNGVARVTIRYTDRFGVSFTREAVLCCQADGASEWRDPEPLDPGDYRVIALAYDQAGNVSSPSSSEILKL